MSSPPSRPRPVAVAAKAAEPSPVRVLPPVLAETAAAMEATLGAAAIFDHDTRLVWVSTEFRELLLEQGHEDDDVGYGKLAIECMTSPTWSQYITPASQFDAFVNDFPCLLWDMPGGKGAAREVFVRCLEERLEGGDPAEEWQSFIGTFGGGDVAGLVDGLLASIEPREPPAVWTSSMEFVQGDLPPTRINETYVRLRDADGRTAGTLLLFDPAVPARVHSLLARGDAAMYGRMLSLVQPGLRQAAIVFADLQESSRLSRKLSSAAYFRLIRDFTTATDDIVARSGGIVGKHAGDGVTAFFTAEDVGSAAAAARAAIETARALNEATREVAETHAEEVGLPAEELCRVNIGAHWGGRLYMGQLVTGGRLEVTALGDAVNECARIQQAARGGRTLGSKMLLEQLAPEDAAALGLDVDKVVYSTIDEIPDAPDKARRDAGQVPVTDLG